MYRQITNIANDVSALLMISSAVIYVVLACGQLHSSGHGESPENDRTKLLDVVDFSKHGRHIIAIEVEWIDEDVYDVAKGLKLNERESLEIIEDGFCSACVLASRTNLYLGRLPDGIMKIKTTDGSFEVGMHDQGLSVGSFRLGTRNTAFSYKIAMELDRQYFTKHGKHLPKRLIDGMSGQRYFEEQEKEFKEFLKQKMK